MKIDKNTTLKIAKLSRIKININEVDELSTQLSSILKWVELLNEVNTDNVKPLSNVSISDLPLREDKEVTQDNSEEVLKNAPEQLENYFVVPKVVE
jgi:aspartyl-tRNA(Asn)/glutamyl-tRNA(Gln) amidotransferase subunit C